MNQARFSQALLTGVCAAAVWLAPMNGIAQQPAPGVTTVSPLTVTAVPQVGRGATLYTPEQLSDAAAKARQDQLIARNAGRDCGVSNPGPEGWIGNFGIGQLSAEEGRAQASAAQAAQVAEAATEAALNARTAAARGEGKPGENEAAELARQAAVSAWQEADDKAKLAHWKVVDLIDIASAFTGGDIGSVIAMEHHRYAPGCSYDMFGRAQGDCSGPFVGMNEVAADFQVRVDQRLAGDTTHRSIFTPEQYADLRLAKVLVVERQEAGAKELRVSGKIVNPRRTAIRVPPLWYSIADKYGAEIKVEQLQAPSGTKKIPARDSQAFTFAIKSIPENAAKTSLTFAPQHRPTLYMTAEMICAGLGGGPLGI